MKKVILLLIVIVFVSCKNDKKTDDKNTKSTNTEKTEKQNDGLTLLKGEFIYFGDAAVLQTHKEIYAVIINKKMHELNDQIQKYKAETTDMIPVEIRGVITPKPDNEEGWDFRVEIKEILSISKPNSEDNNIITIGKE